MIRMIAALAAVSLVSGVAFAGGGHGHGKHQMDAQMMKLHTMMPRYAEVQVSMNAALAKGDLDGVAKEAAYLLSTSADLKQSKPHKNLTRLKEFEAIAAGFEQDVKRTAESAGKGDLAGAKSAFAAAEKRCDSCHAKFRD